MDNNEQLKLILHSLKEYNEALNALNSLGKETVELLGAHIKDIQEYSEHDEKPHMPAPTDEEMDRMHDQWDSERVESESKEYRNAH